MDEKLKKLTEQLKKYGQVSKCEFVNDKVHVIITEGFNPNAFNTFECMKTVTNMFGSTHPNIEKCHTDKDLFNLILKTKV